MVHYTPKATGIKDWIPLKSGVLTSWFKPMAYLEDVQESGQRDTDYERAENTG
jgi:hypothetical protein